jgi:hypothetical protein
MIKELKDYYSFKPRYAEVLSAVDRQTERIIKVLTKFFKVKNFWWAYKYYGGDCDNLPEPQDIENGFFPIYISEPLESRSIDYADGFPVEFFEMTDEDILKYLLEEAAADKQKEIEESKRKEEKKQKKLEQEAKEIEHLSKKLSEIGNLTPKEKKLIKKRLLKL